MPQLQRSTTAWKFAKQYLTFGPNILLVKLMLPAGTEVTALPEDSYSYRKQRAEMAIVVGYRTLILGLPWFPRSAPHSWYAAQWAGHRAFTYERGPVVPTKYREFSSEPGCGEGIHFFYSRRHVWRFVYDHPQTWTDV